MESGPQPLRRNRKKAAAPPLTRPGANRLRVHLSRVHDIAVVKPRTRDLWDFAGIFGRVVAFDPFRLCSACKISRTAVAFSGRR